MKLDPLTLLEYDRILVLIAGHAHSEPTRELIRSLSPLACQEEMTRRFAIFSEIEAIHRLDIPLRIDDFPDIRPLLDRVRPAGAILDSTELLPIRDFLRVAAPLARQIAYRTDIPTLAELLEGLSGFPDILEALEGTIGPDGEIRDTASRELKQIRDRKRSLTQRIRRRLEEIVREREVAIFLQDDFITQRFGRWVIPVRMDSKGMVPGVVHDVSNTGETAFVEPVEIVPLANELENLVAEERAEMIRILKRLSGWIRESAAEIAADFSRVVSADLFQSIARYAFTVDGVVPRLGPAGELLIRGGRHPLLLIRAGGDGVVPLDLHLTPERRIMVITGPNTGGKTVALKTAGLLTLLALTGIPIPASPESVIPLVDQVLVDIGDDQSIEASLSTFSSHVSRLSRILEEGTARSLVLIDELGTGTEPAQGGALSCAILEALREKGAMVIATTHLTPITAFVHREEGMENASMLFDPVTLSPTYLLRVGTPGGSHAFETARRFGIPERVIRRAVELSDDLSTRFHDLVEELARELAGVRDRALSLDRREGELARRDEELRRREKEREEERRVIRTRALADAKDLVSTTRREMNLLLEEMRRERSRKPLEKLAKMEEELDLSLRELAPLSTLDIGSLRPGDRVGVDRAGGDGELLSIDRKGGRARVRLGGKELDLPLASLSPPTGKRVTPTPRHPRDADQCEPPLHCTVIGRRVEEAIPLIERFLDDAVMRGGTEVRIIHGKGTGALRKGVREYLSTHPHVRSVRDGDPFEGGSGMTVVTLG